MAARKCVGSNGNGNGKNGAQPQKELARKKVKMNLQVFVEGRNKTDVDASYENLVSMLASQLPMKLRMGRGLTTTINVEARA